MVSRFLQCSCSTNFNDYCTECSYLLTYRKKKQICRCAYQCLILKIGFLFYSTRWVYSIFSILLLQHARFAIPDYTVNGMKGNPAHTQAQHFTVNVLIFCNMSLLSQYKLFNFFPVFVEVTSNFNRTELFKYSGGQIVSLYISSFKEHH